MGVFLYFFIVLSQLLIENWFIRLIYTLLMIGSLIYIVRKGIKLSFSMVSDQTFDDKVENLLSKHKAKLVMILFVLWGFNILLKLFGNKGGGLFTVIVPILPIIIIGGLFLLQRLFESYIKMYYLDKFSENFRQKFNVPEEVWYGSKYRK